MKIIISGSRGVYDYQELINAVKGSGFNITGIVHGCAKGVDTMADAMAVSMGFTPERHPADWAKHRNKAGLIRNQHMVDNCEANGLIAVWDGVSPGTRHAIEYARSRRLKVYVHLVKSEVTTNPQYKHLLSGQTTPAGYGLSTILPDFDFETYSEAGYYWDESAVRWRGVMKNKSGLPAVGAPRYAEHPTTEVLSLAYDLKDGCGSTLWVPGMDPPHKLLNHVVSGGLLEAWNVSFEFYIWHFVCHLKMGWPALIQRNLRCAMAKGAAWGLPGKLKKAAQATNAQEQKDPKGDALIKKLTVPRKPTKNNPLLRLTPESSPKEFGALYAYNDQDIKAEAAISAITPDLSADELELWLIDQQINTRGVKIDIKTLNDCLSIVKQAKEKYTAELCVITGDPDMTPDKLAQIKKWAATQGVAFESLDAEHVSKYLKDESIPAHVRRVLEIRSSLGAKSVEKLYAMDRTVSSDGRLRDLFGFHGARQTGRFAGMGAQPQNLKNSGPNVLACTPCKGVFYAGLKECPHCWTPADKNNKYDWGIVAAETALKDISTRSLDHVEKYWGDAIEAVSGCLRALFVAEEGKELICSDFSAIEAVVLAVVAGEQWRIDVFNTHGKIYETSAAKTSGVALEEILDYKKRTGQHHPLRKKVGKVGELASGYAGWIGAWKNFGADKFMDDEEIKKAILAWRDESPAIVEFWGGQWRKHPTRWEFTQELYGIEGAAIMAILNPGSCYAFRGISYGVKDSVLYCMLPSGRKLQYHNPRLKPGTAPHGHPIQQIVFDGWNSDSTKGAIGWMQRETYGGRLTENIIQAISRDILAYAMVNVTKAQYPIVLHVHDEVVCEVPKGLGSVKEFEALMATMPPWAKDWPIKAAGGWIGHRYRKD